MNCPKCGENCYLCKVARLSALSYEYHYCSSPICNWDNELEQKEMVKSKYPGLFTPIMELPQQESNWEYPDSWEKFKLGKGRVIEWQHFDSEDEHDHQN